MTSVTESLLPAILYLSFFIPVIDKHSNTCPKSLRLLKISLINNSTLRYFFVISLHWFLAFVVNLINFCRVTNVTIEMPCFKENVIRSHLLQTMVGVSPVTSSIGFVACILKSLSSSTFHVTVLVIVNYPAVF